jgi:ATP-dependent exoDNAse (exonuclease V) alpha subunit
MAIYHLSVKPISRSAGRTATAAAAYRAACEIADERTGEIHDFRRKRGVESSHIVLPKGDFAWASNRASLWNAAEKAEKRKDACTAREFEVALPSELSAFERRQLAIDFAQEMADLEGCGVDVAIHAPSRDGDNRNHHAHILRTTRKIGAHGLGEKLETEKAGRHRRDDLAAVRARWAELVNERLRLNQIDAAIDHRSLQEQGIDRIPTSHLGPAAISIVRRGLTSVVKERIEQEVFERLSRAASEGEKERKSMNQEKGMIDLSTDIAVALAKKEEKEVKRQRMDLMLGQMKDSEQKVQQIGVVVKSSSNDIEWGP